MEHFLLALHCYYELHNALVSHKYLIGTPKTETVNKTVLSIHLQWKWAALLEEKLHMRSTSREQHTTKTTKRDVFFSLSLLFVHLLLAKDIHWDLLRWLLRLDVAEAHTKAKAQKKKQRQEWNEREQKTKQSVVWQIYNIGK